VTVLITLLIAGALVATVVGLTFMALFGLLNLTVRDLTAADDADHPQD